MNIPVPALAVMGSMLSLGARPDELDGLMNILSEKDDPPPGQTMTSWARIFEAAIQEYRRKRNILLTPVKVMEKQNGHQ